MECASLLALLPERSLLRLAKAVASHRIPKWIHSIFKSNRDNPRLLSLSTRYTEASLPL